MEASQSYIFIKVSRMMGVKNNESIRSNHWFGIVYALLRTDAGQDINSVEIEWRRSNCPNIAITM